MSPRTLAPIAAVVSLVFGGIGLIATSPMLALFGITLDHTGSVIARLACASYLGFGVLNWRARNITDAGAWAAIAAGNGVAWGAGAVVAIVGILGLTGPTSLTDARTWLIPALQVAFTALWTIAYLQNGRLATRPVASAV